LPSQNRLRLRALALLASVLSLALLGACGDDDDSDSGGGGTSGANEVTIDVLSIGGSVAFKVPKKVEAGLNDIVFDNQTKKPEDLQLIYVKGDHSEQEVVKAYQEVGQGGKPIPDWFIAGGGAPTTPPGEQTTVTQVLEPGTYYGFASGSGSHTFFEVTGEPADAEVPEGEATVSAFEYGFEAEGLKKGENRLRFDNIGAQPHHAIAFPIVGGATIEDVKTFFKTEKGKPPVAFEQEVSTAVLEGQTAQLVDLEFEKAGRYALVCFITDRQGGPPHALKGMVSEVEVE
jgi:hypothetical protein